VYTVSDEKNSRVRLADAIQELRSEISRARLAGEKESVRFRAKSIKVELLIDFELSGEGKAGVAKWIPFVDLSLKGSAKRKASHKVVIDLEIHDNKLISDSDGPAPVGSSLTGE
jgi:hypothetical protein